MKPPPVRQDQGMLDPMALGRSVVVGPGVVAPGDWSSCTRIRVTGVDRDVADELGAAWRERRSVVIELAPVLGSTTREWLPWRRLPGGSPGSGRQISTSWASGSTMPSGPTRSTHAAAPRTAVALGRGGVQPRSHPHRRRRRRRGATAQSSSATADHSMPRLARVGSMWRSFTGSLSSTGRFRPLGSNDPVGILAGADQLEAVAEPKAVARVIAPAGSGKTRVLTERARLLLRDGACLRPQSALVAYNTRAANEMRGRLSTSPTCGCVR